MEKKINTILNCVYYSFYLIIIAAACSMYKLMKDGVLDILPSLSVMGQVVQYVVISYVIMSVAGGLFIFKCMLERAKKKYQDNQSELLQKYRNYGIVRICVIGVGAVFGVVAFYWMGGYTSMLWCAAIALIGLYFCKPTINKMQLEMATEKMNDTI